MINRIIKRARIVLFWSLAISFAIAVSPGALLVYISYQIFYGDREPEHTATLKQQIVIQNKIIRGNLADLTGKTVPRNFEVTECIENLMYDYKDSKNNLERTKKELYELVR